MQPTDEQQKLIDAACSLKGAYGQPINVMSVAGSGKTSTLEWIAKTDAVRAIYLVADASSRREARTRFPENVAVHTAHSLAFQALVAHDPVMRHKFEAGNNGRAIPMREIASRVDLKAIRDAGHVGASTAAAGVMAIINGFQNSADATLSPNHLDDATLPWPMQKPEMAQRAQAFRQQCRKGACT